MQNNVAAISANRYIRPMQWSRSERVRRAIEFGRPDRVPVVFWNRDQKEHQP